MKILGWMNGWMLAPHCWRRFLLQPVRVEQTPGWTSFTVLGFVAFFDRRPNAPRTAQDALHGPQPGGVLPTPAPPAKTPEIAA